MANRHEELRERDGRTWRIGTQAEVQWIEKNTEYGLTITSAIPPVFEAYATLALPIRKYRRLTSWERHEDALVAVLEAHTEPQPWLLGYLCTGAVRIPFEEASLVSLYADWSYALVEADLAHARRWRTDHRRGHLPDLLFPVDRTCLISNLWDDDWSCIGGARELISAILSNPELGVRAREVVTSLEDATPPGHTTF
jgi:hypothetical protein